MAKNLKSPPVTASGPQGSAGWNDRLTTAAAAKRAMLERFKAAPGVDDPGVQERRAALKAVSDARDLRSAERKSAQEAEAARQAAEAAALVLKQEAERAALAAEQAAHEAEEQRLAAEASARATELEAERKAARDARYAARKARR